MAFERTKGPKKFKDSDLKVAATFVSTEDAPHLKIILKPLEDVYDQVRKAYVSTSGTGLRIKFKAGSLRVTNSNILELLLQHAAFGSSSHGFNIDERDETGFWRELDMVKVQEVKTCVSVGKSADMASLTMKDVKERIGKMATRLEEKKEAVEPLQKLNPIAKKMRRQTPRMAAYGG